ncbi:MAG: PilZ domain-containing protein [Candidatus Omnitrophota bacterium]
MSEWNNSLNRRRSERIDVAYTFTYSVEEPYDLRISLGVPDNVEVLMLNLSDLGMAIITKDDLPVGAKLILKFNLINLNLSGEDRFRHIEIAGEVTSNIVSALTNHRIGICFSKISDADRAAIGEFVKLSRIPSQ